MKNLKNSMSTIILCVFELAVGILLLIDPVSFTKAIFVIAGIVLVVIGVLNVLKYFFTRPDEAIIHQYMAKGLIAVTGGVFCLVNPQWFLNTFPVIAMVYAIAVVIAGILKIQLTFDMLRCKSNKWFLATISAVISIGCGIVILFNPFATLEILWIFTGASLIIEAVLDTITLIINEREKKQREKLEKMIEKDMTEADYVEE